MFGHPALSVIPQTSTIASHLPRAVGLAIAIHRAHRLGVPSPWPADAVVVCSMGDASANHSTAHGRDQHRTQHRVPRNPGADRLRLRGQRLGDLGADSAGLDRGGIRCTPGSRATCMQTERMPGHAWPRRRTQSTCSPESEVAGVPASEDRTVPRSCGQRCGDHATASRPRSAPTTGTTRSSRPPRHWSVRRGQRPRRSWPRYDELRGMVDDELAQLGARAPAVVGSRGDRPAGSAHSRTWLLRSRPATLSPTPAHPATLAEAINATLSEILAAEPRALGVRGGRRRQGRRLRRDPRVGAQARQSAGVRHPPRRAVDPRTGVGIGAWPDCCRSRRSSTSPISTTPRTSCAARRRPCRSSPTGSTATRWSSASPAWPTSADSAGTSTTTTPSPCCATSPASSSPARLAADDAASMLRTCVAAGAVDGTVSVFLEPIALYHQRDLYAARRQWLAGRPTKATHVPIGRARVYGDGTDLDDRDLRQRRADESARSRRSWRPTESRYASSTCAGLRRCPSRT